MEALFTWRPGISDRSRSRPRCRQRLSLLSRSTAFASIGIRILCPAGLPAAKLLHTVEEVTRAPRVGTKTVRRQIAAGAIRRADLGGRVVRIPVSELCRLLGSAPDGDR